MTRFLFVCAISILAFPDFSYAKDVADEYTAEEMLNICTGKLPDVEQAVQSLVCSFRIQGVSVIMVENCLSKEEGFSPIPLLTASVPPSNDAARQAFINFMNANPSKWGEAWHIAFAAAMVENFPCDIAKEEYNLGIAE